MSEDTVPVIDFRPLAGADAAGRRPTVTQIGDACREWGFFQIAHHSIPAQTITRVWREAKRFFALPHEAKTSIGRTEHNPRGYYNRELTKNTRDMKEVFDFGHKPRPDLADDDPANHTQDGYNQWPNPRWSPEFRPALAEYYRACESVAMRLLEALAESLGLPRDALADSFAGGHTSFARLNYYPVIDPLSDSEVTAVDTGHMGVHHHTDAGALTLVLQDEVGGLQVYKGSRWFPVSPVDGAIVVNIGDMVQVWSNDLYRAPLHRVIASAGSDRYSVPYFFNPCYDTDYCPLAALTSQDNPPRYSGINWGDFRRQRQLGDYADFGHEIQIADFRRDATVEQR